MLLSRERVAIGAAHYLGGYRAAVCRPVATFDMPVYLITVSEIEFFKAEYYARYGSAADAQAHYAAAIEASFASANVDGATDYIARYPFEASNYKKSMVFG